MGGKSGIVTKNSFDGTFTDTAGMGRKISWVGNRDYQIDGDGKLPAKKANANTLIADFSSKGGPSAVTVKSLANGEASEWWLERLDQSVAMVLYAEGATGVKPLARCFLLALLCTLLVPKQVTIDHKK